MKREICMHHRGGHIDQRSNFVKDTKNVALTFGGTNNLITLSLSLSLSGTRSAYKDARQSENSQSTFINIRAYVRQYKAFHAFVQGKPACFLSP